MPCSVGNRLYLEYREAVKKWVASINQLKDDRSQAILKRIEENRLCVMLTKEEYQNHVDAHGCGKWTAE